MASSRKVKPDRYYTSKSDPFWYSGSPDLVHVLHVVDERYVFFKKVHFYIAKSLPGYDVILGALTQKEFKHRYKPLSKENYLRRIISEGIDLSSLDSDT